MSSKNENFTSEQAADCARHNVCLGADMVGNGYREYQKIDSAGILPCNLPAPTPTPYETLKQGILTILQCDVSFHEMMAALEALNKKATEVDSYRYYTSSCPCWYCENTCKGNVDCIDNGFHDFDGKFVVDVTKEAVEVMKQQRSNNG